MLNAPTETHAATRSAPRQPQARDAKPAPAGFSSLIDDGGAAKADPARPRDAEPASRATTSPSSRNRREPDDRVTRQTDDAALPDDDAAPDQIACGTIDGAAGKPAKTAGDSPDGQASEQPAKPTADAPVFDPTLALPDPAAPTDAIVVAVPAVVASAPAPVVPGPVSAATPPPLAIAAAGLAAARAATAKTSDAAASSNAAEQPDAASTDESAPSQPTDGQRAKTVATAETDVVKVATGLGKAADAEPAPVESRGAAAPAPAKAATKAAPADATAKPAIPEDAKPSSAPAPAAPPRDHRSAALSTSSPETAPTGPQAVVQPPTNPTGAALSPAAPLTATASANIPVPLGGLAVELAARAQSGASRFEIRLDPADLGRIDVRIDIDRQGQVTSHLTVEKPETLAMLRQDQPQLQRALNEAGLKTADGALQFTLGDQSQPRQNADGGERQTQRFIIRDDDSAASAAPVRGYGRMYAARGGVDISV